MAFQSRTTLKKRQKELARMEKQREKTARKLQRKLTGKQEKSDVETIVPESSGDAGAGGHA